MGVIASCEFNEEGELFKVELRCRPSLDTPFNLQGTFVPAPPYFRITYQPETDDVASPIVPSRCEFSFYDMQDADLNSLIESLVTYQDSGFYLNIERYNQGANKYVRYWHGVVLTDQIKFPLDYRGIYTIKATDGLSLLKNIKNQTLNSTNEGSFFDPIPVTGIKDIFGYCFAQLPQAKDGEYGAGEDFFSIALNVFPDNYIQDSNKAITRYPEDIQYDNAALQKESDDGENTVALSCYEVLEQFAIAFFARVYYSDGRFWFDHIQSRNIDAVIRYVWRYEYSEVVLAVPTGKLLSFGLNFLALEDLTNNSDRQRYIEPGTQFVRYPALTKVSVEQKIWSNEDAPIGVINIKNNTATPDPLSRTIGHYQGTIDGENQKINVTLSYLFNVRIVSYTDGLDDEWVNLDKYPHRRIYMFVTIILRSTESNNTYYYSQEDDDWKTTAVKNKVTTNRNKARLDSIFHYLDRGNFTYTVTTSNGMPESGNIEIKVEYGGIEQNSSSGKDIFNDVPSSDIINASGQITVQVSTDLDRKSVSKIFSLDNPDVRIEGVNELNLGQCNIGDGALQTGYVYYKGSVTDLWQFTDATGQTQYRLLNLLCNQRIDIQKNGLKVYEAGLRTAAPYHYRYRLEGSFDAFMPLQYTFQAQGLIVNGRFAKVKETTTAIVQGPSGRGSAPLAGTGLIGREIGNEQYITRGGLTFGNGLVGPFVDNGDKWIINGNFEIDGDLTVTGLSPGGAQTQDIQDALKNANSPDADNAFATINDIVGLTPGGIQDIIVNLRPIQMFSGEGPPSISTVVDTQGDPVTPRSGDTYFNSLNGDVWKYDGTNWILTGF